MDTIGGVTTIRGKWTYGYFQRYSLLYLSMYDPNSELLDSTLHKVRVSPHTLTLSQLLDVLGKAGKRSDREICIMRLVESYDMSRKLIPTFRPGSYDVVLVTLQHDDKFATHLIYDCRDGAMTWYRAIHSSKRAALMMLLHTCKEHRNANYYVDSMYLYKTFNHWWKEWSVNGYKHRSGKDVLHKELIDAILGEIVDPGRVLVPPEPFCEMMRELRDNDIPKGAHITEI